MAWPKGKPRGKTAPSVADLAGAPATPVERAPLKARPTGVNRFKLKAGANWESTDDSLPDGIDRYHIDKEEIPEGFDLQWVTVSVLGQDMPRERAAFERKGWTPVHQEDFDGTFNGRWMPRDADGEINEGGQVLMARPLEISLKARKRDQQMARDQIRVKEQALYSGDLPISGADHVSARKFNSINRSVERIAVPSDD